jgi:GNAT superfamily N-acetyltransferase
VFGSSSSRLLLGGDPAVGVCQLRYRFAVWTGSEDCGLGRALAEAALARARERGCARVELDVNAANPPGGRNLLMRRRL